MKQLSENQIKAIKTLEQKEFILWGEIANLFEDLLLTKSEAKEVLDFLDIKNTKLRHFVYEQLELNGLG